MRDKEDFELNAIRLGVPRHTSGALARHVFDGIEPGGFLLAVLSNNLLESFGRAAYANLKSMEAIASFIITKFQFFAMEPEESR